MEKRRPTEVANDISSALFRSAVAITLITGSVHLLGSALICGIVSGPLSMLAAPFLAFFGWFYLMPVFVGVSLQWLAYNPNKGAVHYWTVMFISIVTAAFLMGLFGLKEQGSEIRWTVAYVVASGIGAAW